LRRAALLAAAHLAVQSRRWAPHRIKEPLLASRGLCPGSKVRLGGGAGGKWLNLRLSTTQLDDVPFGSGSGSGEEVARPT